MDITNPVYLYILRLGLKPRSNPFELMTLAFARSGFFGSIKAVGRLEFKVKGDSDGHKGELYGEYNFSNFKYNPQEWDAPVPFAICFKDLPRSFFKDALIGFTPKLLKKGYNLCHAGLDGLGDSNLHLSVNMSRDANPVIIRNRGLIKNLREVEEYCGKVGLTIEYRG